MLTMTSSGFIDEQKLRESLRYRSDEFKFETCLEKIKNRYGPIQLIHILNECDLEKALWALRTLSTDQFDDGIRLMACDAVEVVLRNELKPERRHFIEDSFPFDALEVSRAYAKGLLNEDQRRQFENRITYSQWLEKTGSRWDSNNPQLFGGDLTEAALKTMVPEAQIAAYFSILGAHSIAMYPGVDEEDTEAKTKIVREFFESIS